MSKHSFAKSDAFIYYAVRWIAKLFVSFAYGYQSGNVRPRAANYLVYCNHQTLLDPAMVGADFPRHMYFVASEHVVRRKGGRLIQALFHPILRTKARTETDTAMAILRQLRQGHNVCVFIEGECTYDGLPMPIPENAAHLAKLSGAALITYRLHGGYFAHPRWGKGWRKGRAWGELVAEYSPEQLQAMSREALQRQIVADLFVDAYAEQARQPIPYRGKTPAESLETALFACPICHQTGGLVSRGETFRCGCGLSLTYDAYGFFQAQAGKPPFATVQDWFAWQKGWLRDLAAQAGTHPGPLLADAGQDVTLPATGESFQADLALFADTLTLTRPAGAALVFPLAEIREISCHERMRLSFIHNGILYELTSPYARSGVKYQLLFRLLKS